MDDTVKQIVERFGLIPHPEGGFFREVYRAALMVEHPGLPAGENRRRRTSTLIYFLLYDRQFSAFHRVRWTDELWHLYAGGPLQLHVINEDGAYRQSVLTDPLHGEPTALVRAGDWQAARLAPGANWAFGGCTVAPGFEYDDFQMPPRAELLERFGQHAPIIRELTRG
jgi:predicted cupin superfamily sugar epimerase